MPGSEYRKERDHALIFHQLPARERLQVKLLAIDQPDNFLRSWSRWRPLEHEKYVTSLISDITPRAGRKGCTMKFLDVGSARQQEKRTTPTDDHHAANDKPMRGFACTTSIRAPPRVLRAVPTWLQQNRSQASLGYRAPAHAGRFRYSELGTAESRADDE